jgi:hypothetical protein
MEHDDLLDADLFEKPLQKINLVLVGIPPIFMGAILGWGTNAMNSYIYRNDFYGFQRAFGTVEGLQFGLVFGVVFSIVVAKSSRRWLLTQRLFNVYLQCTVIVLILWVLAGSIGALLYHYYPDVDPKAMFYPRRSRPYLGWTKCSIWGTRLGGVVALVWAIYATRGTSRRPSGR